jgi:DnaK suppressor protein
MIHRGRQVESLYRGMMSPEQISRFRSLIRGRLAALTGAEADKRDSARPVELDQTRVGRLSRQDALQSQALSVASLERNRREIGRLREALTRIDEGDYGWCEECGEVIPEARLEVDPAAVYCVPCAHKLEQR